MKDKCRKLAGQALGRGAEEGISDAETDEIESNLKGAKASLIREYHDSGKYEDWSNMTDEQRQAAVAERAARKVLHDSALKERRAKLSLLTRARNMRLVDELHEMKPNGHRRGYRGKAQLRTEVLDNLVAMPYNGRGYALSAEAESKGLFNSYMAGPDGNGAVKAINWLVSGDFEKNESLRTSARNVAAALAPERLGTRPEVIEREKAFNKEIMGEDSGNADAKLAAKYWRTSAERLRNDFNDAGGDIGDLGDQWGLPHAWSKMLVGSHEAEFADDLMKVIDKNHYIHTEGKRQGLPYTDEELRAMCKAIGRNIITGGDASALHTVDGEIKLRRPRGPKGGSGRGGMERERQIFFKNADAYIAFANKYGERSVPEALIHHIRDGSNRVALMRKFGPSPTQGFQFIKQYAVTMDKEESAQNGDLFSKAFPDNPQKRLKLSNSKTTGINRRAVNAQRNYDNLSGANWNGTEGSIGKFVQGLMALESFLKLGKATLSSVNDLTNSVAFARTLGIPYKDAFLNWVRVFRLANGNNELARNLRAQGIGVEFMLNNMFTRYGTGVNGDYSSNGRLFNAALQLNNLGMKINLLNAWTRMGRQAYCSMLSEYLGDLLHSAEAKDLAHAQDLKDRWGISDESWWIWKHSKPQPVGRFEKHSITQMAMRQVSDVAIHQAFPGANAEALRLRAQTDYLSMLRMESEAAVMEQNIRTRSHLGGVSGTTQLGRSAFQFKGTPFAGWCLQMGRMLAAPSLVGSAAILFQLWVGGTIVSYMSDIIRSLLDGNDPQPMTGATLGQAFMRNGGLGVFGDFLQASTSNYGSSVADYLNGPLEGTLSQTIQAGLATARAINGTEKQKRQAAYNGLNLLYSSTMPNTFWANAALRHIFFDSVCNWLIPGFLEQRQQRSLKVYNISPYWDAGNLTNIRPPNIERAVQTQ